jgi:hypothetical protein
MSSIRIFAAPLLLVAVALAQEIPPGTTLPVMLSSTLDARRSKPDEGISARIMQDVPLPHGGHIPEGARVVGRVVETAALTSTAGSHLTLIFDRVDTKGNVIPVVTALRAVASLVAVRDAQLPSRSPVRGESPANWTTVQVGGDVVYRGGGPVMHGDEIVGEPVYHGVLGKLTCDPGCECVDNIEGRGVALWVFSSSACRAYGFDSLKITNSKNVDTAGQITLQSDSNLQVRSGSGLLLLVEPAAPK